MKRLILLVMVFGAFATNSAFAKENIQIMVFSKIGEGAYTHKSIAKGIQTIKSIAKDQHWNVDVSFDAADFNEINLSQYDVVIFLNTTGDILNDKQQSAFENFIRSGGGFVGTHSASDTEYNWPWYGGLVGAYFKNHPKGTPRAKVSMENTDHPAHIYMKDTGFVVDEWYDFQQNPRNSSKTILLTVDESTYENGGMGDDHPIAWTQEYDGGRSFYTALGHEFQSDHPFLKQHLTGGIIWAAGADENEQSLFDGKTMSGWHSVDEGIWRVEDGALTGGSLDEMMKKNTFLISEHSYQNFELKLKVRLLGTVGFVNSGFQIRSQPIAGSNGVSGYQVDAGDLWWGRLYDEERRNRVIANSADMYAVDTAVRRGDWNEYRIVADGRNIRSWINGVPALDYLEADDNIPQDGYIAIQVHSDGITKIQIKDITITERADIPGLPTWADTGMPTLKEH